jgi:RHS repeat-associated protein
LQKIPIIEKKQVVNFVKTSSFSQYLCGFFAVKCSQDDVGNLVTKVVNNRNAEYESNLVNQYVQRAIPNVLDIYGQRYAGSEVLVNDQITQRRNRYFYTTQTVENSVFAVPLVVEVKTDGAVDESRVAFVPKNPEAFVHDDRGNLIKDGQWNYSWNGLNQLVGMETRSDVGVSPIVKLAFAYDSEGRRWKKTVWKDGVLSYERRFLYDGFNLIAELNGNNAVLKTYVWGTDLSGSMQGAGGVGGLLSMTDHVTGNSYFYLHDGNGNVVGLVDSVSGVVVKEYEYGPFGKVLVETDAGSGVAVENSFGFSGKYLDSETGLSYYGYRYYSSEMGRWISRDPIAEQGGMNLYGFCGNDSINAIDYLGNYQFVKSIWLSEDTFQNALSIFDNIILNNVSNLSTALLNTYNSELDIKVSDRIKFYNQFEIQICPAEATFIKERIRPAYIHLMQIFYGMYAGLKGEEKIGIDKALYSNGDTQAVYLPLGSFNAIISGYISYPGMIIDDDTSEDSLFHELTHHLGSDDYGNSYSNIGPYSNGSGGHSTEANKAIEKADSAQYIEQFYINFKGRGAEDAILEVIHDFISSLHIEYQNLQQQQ